MPHDSARAIDELICRGVRETSIDNLLGPDPVRYRGLFGRFNQSGARPYIDRGLKRRRAGGSANRAAVSLHAEVISDPEASSPTIQSSSKSSWPFSPIPRDSRNHAYTIIGQTISKAGETSSARSRAAGLHRKKKQSLRGAATSITSRPAAHTTKQMTAACAVIGNCINRSMSFIALPLENRTRRN